MPPSSLQHHAVGVQPSRVGRAQPEPGVKGAHGRSEVSQRLQHQPVLKPPVRKRRVEARGACVAARGGVEPAIVLERVAKAHQLVGTGVGSIRTLAVAREGRSAHAVAERVGERAERRHERRGGAKFGNKETASAQVTASTTFTLGLVRWSFPPTVERHARAPDAEREQPLLER